MKLGPQHFTQSERMKCGKTNLDYGGSFYLYSFTFSRRLKAHAVEYNGKNTLTVKIKN